MVTAIAVVERSSGHGADLFVADRKTGAPISDADVTLWEGQRRQSDGKTDADGFAALTMQVRGAASGASPENVWILARHGSDEALITPWSYSFSSSGGNGL